MTIEINRGGSIYIYKIDADDPRLITRRLNKHRARWQSWRMFETAELAKAALWKLKGNGKDAGDE